MARRLCLRCRSDGLQEYHGTAPKRNSEGDELRTCHVRLSFRDRVTPPNHQLHLIDASYKKNLTLSARAATKTSSCAWLRVEGIGPLLSNLWYVRTHCPSASAHGCRPLFQDCGLPSLSDPIRVIQRSWRPVEDALHAQHVWGLRTWMHTPGPRPPQAQAPDGSLFAPAVPTPVMRPCSTAHIRKSPLPGLFEGVVGRFTDPTHQPIEMPHG
jgi:hypothetical protein